jgi:pimeloyl-ACP methyl ester carboxylesterase
MLEWGVRDESALGRLNAIHQPALVAGGENDLVIPAAAVLLLGESLPNARTRLYPDSGHGFLFQYHEEFAREVLDFLH